MLPDPQSKMYYAEPVFEIDVADAVATTDEIVFDIDR
jgi:hypothetical protein